MCAKSIVLTTTVGVFAAAEAVLASGQALEVYVFLDECNTCASMGLVCEAIVHRSLNGRRIPDQVHHVPATHFYRCKF